jgi:hypothetical protein
MNTFAKVYATTSAFEAGFLRMALVDHGIPCTIENQGAAAYAIGLATQAAPLVITVPEPHAETARQVIAAARRAIAQPPSADTIPMQSVVCECGETLEVPEGCIEQSIECPFCSAAVRIPGEAAPPAAAVEVLWLNQVVGGIRADRVSPPEVRGRWVTGESFRAPEFLVELWAGKELPVTLRRAGEEPVEGTATMPPDSEELVVKLALRS